MGQGSITRRKVVHEAGHDVDVVGSEPAFFVDGLATVPRGAERLEPLEGVGQFTCLVHLAI
jgi:hypothetical protein